MHTDHLQSKRYGGVLTVKASHALARVRMVLPFPLLGRSTVCAQGARLGIPLSRSPRPERIRARPARRLPPARMAMLSRPAGIGDGRGEPKIGHKARVPFVHAAGSGCGWS